MKKWIGLLMLALLLLLTGCVWEQTPETAAPTAPPETELPEVIFEPEPTERKYRGVELNLCMALEETDAEIPMLLQAAEVFEATTGGKVNLILLSNEELNRKISAGEADVFQTDTATLAQYKSGVLDLTDMANAAGYEGKSFEALRGQVIDSCGFLGAIPRVPVLGGIYYNRTAFENCGIAANPKDWAEFLTLCQTLMEAGWMPLTMDLEDARIMLELHLQGSLGAHRLEALKGEESWQQDEEAIAVIQQIIDFLKAGYLVKGTPAESPAGQNRMGLSNVAMMVAVNTDCKSVEDAAQTALNWGVMPYPGTNAGGVYVSSQAMAVSNACADTQAAFDFIMLLTTGEFDQLRADLTGGIPADPNNQCLIYGAAETLRTAKPVQLGLLGEDKEEMSRYLWQSWYGSGNAFAKVWDQKK